MGMFDYFISSDESVQVQLKVGPCILNLYREGSEVRNHISDGVYYGYEGVVVVKGGVVQSVTEMTPANVDPALPKFNKWGGVFNPETDTLDGHSPVVKATENVHVQKDNG